MLARYKVVFGFALENWAVIVNNYRACAAVPGPALVINLLPLPTNVPPPPVLRQSQAYFKNGWDEINITT